MSVAGTTLKDSTRIWRQRGRAQIRIELGRIGFGVVTNSRHVLAAASRDQPRLRRAPPASPPGPKLFNRIVVELRVEATLR